MTEGKRAKPVRQPAEPEVVTVTVEQAFGSTRWAWRQVKVARPPEARKSSAPKGLHSWRRLPKWPLRRKPLSLTVTYRGGPECWYEVHSRGRSARFTGAVQLHDLMRAIAGHE